MAHNKTIIDLSPSEVAKALAPGLQALAYQKIEATVMEELRPYVKEWITKCFHGVQVTKSDVQRNYDIIGGKMRFLVEVDFENPIA